MPKAKKISRTNSLIDDADKIMRIYTQTKKRKREVKEKVSKEGFIWTSTDGYKRIYLNGKIHYYARVLAENYLGRPLSSKERVTYLDGNKANCVLENLGISMIVPIKDYHTYTF